MKEKFSELAEIKRLAQALFFQEQKIAEHKRNIKFYEDNKKEIMKKLKYLVKK